MSDIVNRLRGLADVFEAQQAPHNLVLHMRAGADEIERLRAGGCARDQGTTQYCAEAAAMAKDIDTLRGIVDEYLQENERLRAAITWIKPPFVDDNTPEAELRQRVKFCVADAERATPSAPEKEGK